MDEVTSTGPGAEAVELAALTARVAELERVVRTLTQRGGAVTVRAALAERQAAERPAASVRPAVAPPPPPVSGAGQPAAAKATVDGVPLVSPLAARPVFPQFTAPAPAKDGKSLENRLGAQVFNLVGILALVISAAYGLKLAIEHGYLGPVARVLIGIAAGVGVVLWSEVLRRKKMVAFSYSLKAVGSAVLYLTLWAGFQLYHLPQLPAGVALGAMILVTAWNAFMAWSQDSELLAAYALAGGFLTPLLLSTGGNHEGFLFIYLGAIDLALVILLRYKPWRLLVPGAFVPTLFFFAGWYAKFFHSDAAGVQAWDGQSTETALFAAMFAAIFAVLPIGGASAEIDGDVIVPVLLPLGYGAFLGVSLAQVMRDSGLHAGVAWLMVGLAAVMLGLMRLQHKAVSRALHLAMAVIALTVAIPLKASGHTLTTAWLVEGLVLLWASTRFEKEERQASGVLYGLSALGYALGLASLLAHWFVGSVFGMDGFFNRDLGAAAVAVVTLGGAVWLALKEREKAPEMDVAGLAGASGLGAGLAGPGLAGAGVSVVGLVGIAAVGALLCLRELSLVVGDGNGEGFATAAFATALMGLGVLAGVTYVSLRLKQTGVAAMEGLALAGLLAIDGVGLLFCLRELFLTWSDSAAQGFANPAFATALVGLGVLAGSTYVSLRLTRMGMAAERLALVGFVLMDGVGFLFCLRELASTWSDNSHQGFANALFATALVGLAVFAGVAYATWRLSKTGLGGMRTLAGATVILFNLMTILTVEREIGALWHRGDANLQRSLAISGFLMAYGAGLLAIGFVKRTAFIRWQALVLLLFTICKVFLYDISGLSAGYRVASFMGLGAVLMGISYAYQKDWLGLKEPPSAAGIAEPPVGAGPVGAGPVGAGPVGAGPVGAGPVESEPVAAEPLAPALEPQESAVAFEPEAPRVEESQADRDGER